LIHPFEQIFELVEPTEPVIWLVQSIRGAKAPSCAL
jgi:hypothetical protein